MVGFITKNSTYMVDKQRHLVTGGVFRDKWHKYAKLKAIAGTSAIIQLETGRVVKTSIVRTYI